MWSSSAEVSAKRYRYTGKEKDEETGLYYHGARYYAPWLGRWTAADPAGLVDGLNLYPYSRDNPINFSDPSGTESQVDDTRTIARGEYTGKESQDFVRGEYFVKTGLTYEGDAAWDDQTKRWLVDVSQLAQPETIEFDGEEVTSEVPQAAPPTPPPAPATDTAGPGGGESIGEQFLRGAVLGDFGGEATVASVVGQIAVGFTPLGVAADVRDLAAALKELKDGKSGAGVNVVLAGIGFLPFGDLAKVLRKSDDVLEAGADVARIADDVPANALSPGRHGDFHGPWQEPPGKDFKYGEYLKKRSGTEPPAEMANPHAHHAVFKRGRMGRQRRLVEEAHDILRRRAGVDPFRGLDNLGWAPNKGHSTAVMEDILSRLKALDEVNGSPEQFRDLLERFRDEASRR